MNTDLDDAYLTWLYSQVDARCVREKNPTRTYWSLMAYLYSIEFVYFIGMDENRAEDGRALRYEWDDEHDLPVPTEWLLRGCSFLEMLIALSRRLEFEGDGHADVWFWHLIENLGLQHYNDRVGFHPATVQNVVDTVIWRTYDRNGKGGLFPLKKAPKDLRDQELWYQMNTYLQTT